MRKLLFLLALAACGDEETRLASTQLTLTIQAESGLRSKLDDLRATLFVNQGGAWTQRSSVDVPASRLNWPLDIPILARAGDESAQVEVIVEAYANAQRLAQARVVTRFAKDDVRTIATGLFECAGRAPGAVCAEDGCHGEGCAVCSEGGACTSLQPTDDEGLDAATPHDAAAGPSDAGTPSDGAAMLPACPANACAAPYACIPTPTGYTCRGQFADWPMPDKVPGAKVPPSYTATPDFVTDNVTKLVWQSGLPRIYPGCTEYVEYSDNTKGDVGELCTRAQGKAYCDNLVHGGFDDWRLPTAIELISLYDLTEASNEYAIDPAAFADTEFGPFVSDSTYAGGPSQAWGINYYARANYYAPNYSGKIRCVRAGALPSFATPADRYLIVAEQVTDRATGLVWQRASSSVLYANEADAGAPLLTGACVAPWRVPTVKELFTLVDFTRAKPALQGSVFPNTATDHSYWGLPVTSGNAIDFETAELQASVEVGYVRCVQ
jgi:hypothetical protein